MLPSGDYRTGMTHVLPDDYTTTLEDLKRQVHGAHYEVRRRVNSQLLRMYWRIGRTISERQESQAWGTKMLELGPGDWHVAELNLAL